MTESPASVPSSPEGELFSGTGDASQFMTIENEFADQDDNTRESSLCTPVIFPDDSPMQIYKTLTEETLRIIIDGTNFFITTVFV